ncbi:glycosyltransferase family 2 protein [Phocaeicola sp.]
MTSDVLVSILIPVYKVELYIEKCATSIFSQTYENIEYVFVDDCSTDNSIVKLEEVIQRYPQRKNQIKLISNPENVGIAKVRDILLANATGKYLLFIDSDDWVGDTMIEDLVKKAEATDADIVCCDLIYEYPHGSVYYSFYPRIDNMEYLKDISLDILKTYLVLLFTKRDLYVANRLSFNAGINVCEDFIMYNRLFLYAGKIEHLQVAYYHYFRGNPNSYTVLSMQNILDRIKAIGIVEQFFISNGLFDKLGKSLKRKKFETKKEFIVNPKFRNFDKWRNTFPESNYSWRNSNIGTRNKLACLLVSLHLDAIVRLFFKIKVFDS